MVGNERKTYSNWLKQKKKKVGKKKYFSSYN